MCAWNGACGDREQRIWRHDATMSAEGVVEAPAGEVASTLQPAVKIALSDTSRNRAACMEANDLETRAKCSACRGTKHSRRHAYKG
jgi:hypothetical protein